MDTPRYSVECSCSRLTGRAAIFADCGGARSAGSRFPGGISSDELSAAAALLATLGGVVDSADRIFNVASPTSGFVEGATERRVLNQDFLHLYAGDTWRVAPETGLTMGVRWELRGVPDEAQGLALLPVGGVDAVLDPDAVVDFAGSSHTTPFFDRDRTTAWPLLGTPVA